MSRLIEELEPFVNQYGVTTMASRVTGTDASADIFEETLLRMAGIKTQPTSCRFDFTAKNLDFSIAGLTENDVIEFSKFLNIPAEKVTRGADGETTFSVPTDEIDNRYFPMFKNQIANDFAKSPELLKRYIQQNFVMVHIMGALEEVDNALENKNPDFSKIQEDFANTLMFIMNADQVFNRVSYKAINDSLEDVQEFHEKNPNVNDDAKAGLERLAKFLQLFVIARSPVSALKAHEKAPRDQAGHRIRFFDRSISDNLLEAAGLESDKEDKMELGMRA